MSSHISLRRRRVRRAQSDAEAPVVEVRDPLLLRNNAEADNQNQGKPKFERPRSQCSSD